MAEKVVRLRIISSRALYSMIAGERSFGCEYILDDRNPDIVILDTRNASHAEKLKILRESLDVPVLIIIRNHRELPEVFPWMEPSDDICLAKNFRTVAPFRISRMFQDRLGRTASEQGTQLFRDPLTGLANRIQGLKTLETWMSEASPSKPLSVILLDVDRFKTINDAWGHNVGDRVLAGLGQLLRPHLSDEIDACRFGGEEFLIVMKAGNHRACEFAEFLRREIENNLRIRPDAGSMNLVEEEQTDEISVSASFGVASCQEPGNPSGLVRNADRLLYLAKSEGRNRVEGRLSWGEDESREMSEEDMLRDFEARLRVTTDRLVEDLSLRGRKLAGYYRKEADLDGMTGLYRKEYFTRRFAREFENARRDSQALTLLFLDLDNFGNVNRTYGYPTGDSTLKKVSSLMLDSVRSVDWAARYGGEELCIIMPATPISEARQVAERLRASVQELQITAYDGRHFGVTASIGLAELSASDKQPVDLIQRAGDKTREAKKAGKNIVRF